MRRTSFLTLVLIVACICCGCGYTTRSAILPEKYHTIAVPVFKNSSMKAELTPLITDAVRRKFELDTQLRVVPDPETADLALEGAITEYRLLPLNYDDQDNITQFQIYLATAFRLRDTKTNEIVREMAKLEGTTSFLTKYYVNTTMPHGTVSYHMQSPYSFPSSNENNAVAEAIEDAANNIFFIVLEGWGL